jgi:nucleoside-diphosphate kinase
MERTLAIIKPDAFKSADLIEQRIRDEGLLVVARENRVQLSLTQARRFYLVHHTRPFYNSLCKYMTSGPVVLLVLEGVDAIRRWRNLMGATDPKNAEPGTVRRDFGTDVERNATHGSDGPSTARQEIAFFFPDLT